MKFKFLRPAVRRYLFITLAALLVGFGVHLGWMFINHNFHAVVDGELYRSAQVQPGDLARYRRDYGIQTVINLRGVNANESWYRQEVAEAQAQHMTLINYGISAKRELPFENAWELIRIMASAPKPILVHCKSGIDRTGLAAALYLAGVKHADEDTSEMQMSLYYGHIPLSISPYFAVNQTFEDLEPSLGYFGS